MKESVKQTLDTLIERNPELAPLKDTVADAFAMLAGCYHDSGKLLICGNGGSCADSEHIVGELMKCFKLKRPIPKEISDNLAAYGEEGEALRSHLEGALPAISLCGHPALTTAFMNDTEPSMTFAQQTLGYGRPGDVLIAISTSGNSKNCVYAALTAKSIGMKVLALTGEKDSRLSALADLCIKVPSKETYQIQEYHLPIYHCLCAMLEAEFFG